MIILFTVANQPNVMGPYNFYSTTYSTGLTTMVASLAGGTLPPTPALLNTALYNYIQPLYFINPNPPLIDQQYKINSLTGTQYNAYIDDKNPAWAFYSQKQLNIINKFIDDLNKVPVNTLAYNNFMSLSTESLAITDLSIQDQAPLLMALTLAAAAQAYFYPQILAPSANWATFIDSNCSVNFMNLNAWITAAYVGALIGYTQSVMEMPTTAPDGAGVGDNLITATTSALVATFGRIIFEWEQRPPKTCTC